MASLGAALHWMRREVEATRAAPTTAPVGIRLVFVPGHGSPESGTFDDLMGMLGVSDTGGLDVLQLDHRDLVASASHPDAARRSTVDDLADGLGVMLRALGRGGEQIYLVGHSKGAAAIAELLARWDRDPERAVPEVVGAALLDPPMSGGLLGLAQGAGRHLHHAIPHDGGYSPHRCSLRGCRDTRDHLGTAAGVEVIVFRNPDALVTNFTDAPDGLRVYDISQPGSEPRVDPSSIGAAHSYPLRSQAVAACIADELRRRGSCRWPIRRWLAGEGP